MGRHRRRHPRRADRGRRHGIGFAALADALAPAVLVGQAIGRIGCWFNQELYGRPTTLPWGLEIDPANRPATTPDTATYHPTFAYEAAWDLGAAALVIWAERRFRLDRGRVFALYVAAYTAGHGGIETLRVDPANHILGLRLNVWTSLLLFLAAVAFLLLRRHPAPAAGLPGPMESAVPATAADLPVLAESVAPASGETRSAPAPLPADADAAARERATAPGRMP